MESKDCVIVFAREPEKGRVKTRLQSCLGHERCVEVYKAFLNDTLALVRAIPSAAKILAYTAHTITPRYLEKIGQGFVLYRQKGRGLGARMHDAFQFAERMYKGKTVIIGSDSPNVPVRYIQEAFRRLAGSDIVLGPSLDGGHYLIGLKAACSGLFKGVPWSSIEALEYTIQNARTLNKRVALLEAWYDVDDADGFARLKRDLKKKKNTAPWTRKVLKI